MTDQPIPEIDGGTPPHAIEDAPAPPSLFHAGASVLREAAQFLSDRLDDLEWMDGDLESTCRDYMGHVDPAHYRLKSILATPGDCVLMERKLDDDCGCPEEMWDTPWGELHMHLSAGKASNACLDNGDEGERHIDLTTATIDEARAAIFAWAAHSSTLEG